MSLSKWLNHLHRYSRTAHGTACQLFLHLNTLGKGESTPMPSLWSQFLWQAWRGLNLPWYQNYRYFCCPKPSFHEHTCFKYYLLWMAFWSNRADNQINGPDLFNTADLRSPSPSGDILLICFRLLRISRRYRCPACDGYHADNFVYNFSC